MVRWQCDLACMLSPLTSQSCRPASFGSVSGSGAPDIIFNTCFHCILDPLGTSASLLGTSALLVVTRSYNKKQESNRYNKLLETSLQGERN